MTRNDTKHACLVSDAPEEIDPAHLEDVLKSLAQARCGEFASDAEVEAALCRFEGEGYC
jgi:hypothetical protein